MNTEQWTKWFRGWLEEHPLKAQPQFLRARFVEDVMYRIRNARAPAPAFRWFPRPRFAFTLGTAAVCAVLVAVLGGRSSDTLVRQVTHDAQALLEAGEFAQLNGTNLESDELNELDEMGDS